MNSLPLDTRKLYHRIRQDVITVHYLTSVLRKLSVPETQQLVQQEFPSLHRTFYNEILDSIVLNMARLLDPARVMGHVNASLEQLVMEIHSTNPQLATQLSNLRDALIRDLPKIALWRDKWAAHRDYDQMLIMQTIPRPPGSVTFNIDQLLSAIGEFDSFLNAFEMEFGNRPIINPKDPSEVNPYVPGPSQYSVFDATSEIEKLLSMITERSEE